MFWNKAICHIYLAMHFTRGESVVSGLDIAETDSFELELQDVAKYFELLGCKNGFTSLS